MAFYRYYQVDTCDRIIDFRSFQSASDALARVQTHKLCVEREWLTVELWERYRRVAFPDSAK